MKTVFALVLAVVLAGCGKDIGPVAIAPPKPQPLVVAPECDPAGDPVWTNPADKDVRLKEAVRRDDHNGDAFDDVTDARAVCWASLKNRVRTGETSNQATGSK